MRGSWLECQDCGTPLVEMDNALQQRVADNPYAYVIYCFSCKRDRERELLHE